MVKIDSNMKRKWLEWKEKSNTTCFLPYTSSACKKDVFCIIEIVRMRERERERERM